MPRTVIEPKPIRKLIDELSDAASKVLNRAREDKKLWRPASVEVDAEFVLTADVAFEDGDMVALRGEVSAPLGDLPASGSIGSGFSSETDRRSDGVAIIKFRVQGSV